jgi:hypothetical protein
MTDQFIVLHLFEDRQDEYTDAEVVAVTEDYDLAHRIASYEMLCWLTSQGTEEAVVMPELQKTLDELGVTLDDCDNGKMWRLSHTVSPDIAAHACLMLSSANDGLFLLHTMKIIARSQTPPEQAPWRGQDVRKEWRW